MRSAPCDGQSSWRAVVAADRRFQSIVEGLRTMHRRNVRCARHEISVLTIALLAGSTKHVRHVAGIRTPPSSDLVAVHEAGDRIDP